MKSFLAILPIVFLLLFSNPVFAQDPSADTVFTEIWNAINKLDGKVIQMIDDIQTLYSGMNATANELILFKNDVNNSITNLNNADTLLQNQIDLTNISVQNNLAETTQKISDLNAVDQSLQNQINLFETESISRDKLYEVTGSGSFITEVYCDDENDILMNSYCAGGFLGDLSQTVGVFTDDFSDGDYTNNPQWLVDSGSWTASSQVLIGTLSGSSISNYFAMNSGHDYQIHLKMQQNAPNVMGVFKWFTTGGGRTANGYEIWFHETGNIFLYKLVGGAYTQLEQLGQFQNGSEYAIDILHRQNGLIEISINGNPAGIVSDNTFGGGSAITVWTGNSNGGFSFDDFAINSDVIGNIPGGFVNVYDVNEPMGIICNYGREARIICYNPD